MSRVWMTVGFLGLLLVACATSGGVDNPEVLKTSQDGRFIAYNNATVKDTSTGLLWASGDNDTPVTWEEAMTFCRDYRGGGHDDWRMPTQEELTALYHPKITNTRTPTGGCKGGYHITDLIHITCCCIWYWNGVDEVGGFFHFDTGPGGWRDQSLSLHPRALPVRDPN